MTNVLDLSRNFCYNNNREVKAKMTRRTREAMASELQLPEHYVELDSQEIMYVDGGAFTSTWLSGNEGLLRLAHFGGVSVAACVEFLASCFVGAATAPTGVGLAVAVANLAKCMFVGIWNLASFVTAAVGMLAYGGFQYNVLTGWFGFRFDYVTL